VQLRAGAIIIAPDQFFNDRRERIAALALHHALPSVYTRREFAVAGGLMSYGTSLSDIYRQAGVYAGRILKGAQPADLPIVQSTKLELVINLKTARALGLTLPPSFYWRAAEVSTSPEVFLRRNWPEAADSVCLLDVRSFGGEADSI
jgi:putative tryptophan/tyrosine transport system substrate-binding protein